MKTAGFPLCFGDMHGKYPAMIFRTHKFGVHIFGEHDLLIKAGIFKFVHFKQARFPSSCFFM